MTGGTGHFGAFLIAWSQTEIDGRSGVVEADITVGAYWRWQGEAVEVTDAIDLRSFALPDCADSPEVLHHCLAEAAANVVLRALGGGRHGGPATGARLFTLTDGIRTWTATSVAVPGAAQPLLAFAPSMPPARKLLRIVGTAMVGGTEAVPPADTMVCFTPGTWIETPGGARQIEFLAAGDKVVTLDAGPQEIVWIGSRQLGIGELNRNPDAKPIRIRDGALGRPRGAGDLLVSPDHRMLLRRGHIGGGGEESEVLVAARHLADGETVLRDARARSVTYVHVLLETHHIISANGMETETFHPGQAALEDLIDSDRTRLLDVMPHLGQDPARYGPTARPVLSRAEFALLSAA